MKSINTKISLMINKSFSFSRQHIGPLLILFLLFFKSERLIAQYEGIEQFQVYAPNTYSLGQYGDIPVNLSMGIPQINVPITKFSDKDIDINVSLSYHASGIKVDQEASWVGLGWALNSGGVITRQMRGLPDGYTSYGLRKRVAIADKDAATSIDDYLDQEEQNIRDGAFQAKDNEIDIFYYNFAGKSGRFFLDENANATLAQYEDFKIEFVQPQDNVPVGETRGDFIISDDRGFIYEFKAQETTYNNYSQQRYVSAWYLSRITSPSGGELNFEYTTGGISTLIHQKRTYNEAHFVVNGNNSTRILPEKYRTPHITYDSDINGIIPKKITNSSGEYLEFITATGLRCDSEIGNNKLEYILLKNRDNQQVKKFRLDYGCFEANNAKKLPLETATGSILKLNYRLRLDAFHEVSLDGSEKTYRFEYYGDDNPETDDPYTLPYRLSPAQDHYGYYNNSHNESIFPNNSTDKAFRIDGWFQVLSDTGGSGYLGVGTNFAYGVTGGGTRDTDSEGVKACTLNKIIYPTGGYASFDFEAHPIDYDSYYQWRLMGGLRIKEIEIKEDASSDPIIKKYEYLNYQSGEKCQFSAENPYYAWYNSNYSTNPPSSADVELLAAFGVPQHLSVNNRFIAHVVSTSQLKLGVGTNALYTRVKEYSPGNGYNIYEYNFFPDAEFGNWNYEGVALSGSFYSAYVQTQTLGGIISPTVLGGYGFSSCTFPYLNFLNNDWRRGHLLSKKTYLEGSTTPLMTSSTEYDIYAIKAVPSYKVISFGDNIRYIYGRYYDIGGIAKPIIQKTERYNDDGSYIEHIKELDYNSFYHKQITETREYTSLGEEIKTEYKYPQDSDMSGEPHVQDLINQNRIAIPLKTIVKKDGKIISEEKTEYEKDASTSNLVLPKFFFSKKGAGGINALIDKKITYNEYDEKGNLEQYKLENGIPVYYIWGYQKQYPIAKIENFTTAQANTIQASLIDPAITASDNDNSIETENTLRIKLNDLRNSEALSEAMVTTYTYDPLIGVTSITDPKGYTTYYEYDDFNRLKFVKDADKNIISENKYNYKNQ